MKKIISTSIVLVICFIKTYSQITLENTYSNPNFFSFYLTKLSVGEKYYYYNDNTNELKLYNLNHSIFKTINIPSFANNGYDVYYISDNLFDLNANIEYLISGYYLSGIKFVKIIDEYGTIIFTGDSMRPASHPLTGDGVECIANTGSGTKMILYKNDSAKVFSLPGVLLLSKHYNERLINTDVSIPYPNPTTKFTRIDYNLPNEIDKGEIIIYNNLGNEIKRYSVDRSFDHLLITSDDLPSGSYYYNLQTKNGIIKGYKIVIAK